MLWHALSPQCSFCNLTLFLTDRWPLRPFEVPVTPKKNDAHWCVVPDGLHMDVQASMTFCNMTLVFYLSPRLSQEAWCRCD